MRSRPTTSVRGEYQGISMVSSPTNHKPPPLLYRVNGTILTVSKPSLCDHLVMLIFYCCSCWCDAAQLVIIWMTTWLVEDVVYH